MPSELLLKKSDCYPGYLSCTCPEGIKDNLLVGTICLVCDRRYTVFWLILLARRQNNKHAAVEKLLMLKRQNFRMSLSL
uniref:Uncharacterized protein n=1 Tax=Ditylenchus dipsaci TaxID=166011 RepID=A0A915D244_9BILA